ncbi:tyrosine-type recombinase/integrase [Accumulibacter sp.]|uniref:tyrosine-type recombinase/integrase n=1 Tax=Accumulibacter sp. TaxID=2053492 RepID=UPI001DF72132|nr:tyrosine-type recombinase/integrase [Accumulibacter sp.]MCB1966280.1 tyrosine-type recombinase/integrase [Accumulibacter sp.]MCP5229594.1 tyrosine-type recombinase/integrase [Accumulibacter sp.]
MTSVSLQARVEQYLVERRRLGFSGRSEKYPLRSFAKYVQAIGHRGSLTIEVMANWARCDSHGSDDPLTWARRLKKLRTFLRWLQQFEPRTEVPDDSVFGRLPERLSPHIYSDQEIIDLLAAARRLGPAPGLRGAVYETLFGLIASTGMRISEALGLRNDDVDLKYGMLSIHQTKFGKSRQVPLHPSAVEALRRYRWIRDLAGDFAQEDAPLFIGTRGRRRGLPLDSRQVHRVFIALREQLGWRNRGAHHAPRIHDLRHTFVVRRILLWQSQGADVDQAMLSLSTYVGHAMVTNTYWYLSAVPELMALAGRRFESYLDQPEVPDA